MLLLLLLLNQRALKEMEIKDDHGARFTFKELLDMDSRFPYLLIPIDTYQVLLLPLPLRLSQSQAEWISLTYLRTTATAVVASTTTA